MTTARIYLWDLPTRLIHWLLLLLVITALVTGLRGGSWMVWHERAGLAIFALVVLRLIWGLIGSSYAQFRQFVPIPKRVLLYLRGHWHGEGHTPLGALSVLAMLAVLLMQAGSGLFANDDIVTKGPLYPLVSASTSDLLTRLHRQGLGMIVGLVTLHISAVLFYWLVRRQQLIMPMISGWKNTNNPQAQSAQGGGWRSLIIALALTSALLWVASGGLLSPPPPVSTTLPDW